VASNNKNKLRCGGLIGLIVLIALIVWGFQSLFGSHKSADFNAKVNSVVALDGNEVRVYYTVTNVGKASGTATCVMTTNSQNQFSDQTANVNSTGSNGNIAPGKSQTLYQDVGVPSGNASSVTAADVTINSCSSS
jgi:hypothetical protein